MAKELENKIVDNFGAIPMQKNVYSKLQDLRVELQNLQLKKTGLNKFTKVAYYELKDFLPFCNILMQKYQICAVFNHNKDNSILTIYNSDFPSESIEFTSENASADVKGATPIQSVGSQQTYQRRYLYMMAFEIVENDLVENLAGSKEIYDLVDNEDLAKIEVAYKANNINIDEWKSILTEFNAKKKNDFKQQDLDRIIEYMNYIGKMKNE